VIGKLGQKERGFIMSVKDAKQQIFDSLYNDFINTGKNPSRDAEGLRKQLNISEDEFWKALKDFVDLHDQLLVVVDLQTKQVRLGASGTLKRGTF
jgi:hypothetical protein